MRLVELKIKIGSLAAEAQIIRREEERRKRFFKGPRRQIVKCDTDVVLSCGHQLRIKVPVGVYHIYGVGLRVPCKQCKQKLEGFAERKAIGERIAAEVHSLQEHRRFDVRRESRSAGLAYGFLRGMPYKRIEEKCWTAPDWETVKAIVKRFAPGRNDLDIDAWIAA